MFRDRGAYRNGRFAPAALIVCGALAVALPALGAGPSTTLISVNVDGTPADHGGTTPSVSASGRFVAFASNSPSLPDHDADQDVYVRDRKTAETHLVSLTPDGVAPDDNSHSPSISASGRFVAFDSESDSLPGGGAFRNVYVRDVKGGVTELISVTSAEAPADDDSAAASISASGRFVAFESRADNLSGEPLGTNVYLRDRMSGETHLVSVKSDGTPLNYGGENPSVSASGRYVAFESDATNLPGDDLARDVYLHDMETGNTRLISKASAAVPLPMFSETNQDPAISASGRRVAFMSNAIPPPEGPRALRIYVYDRRTGETRLVSKTSSGKPVAGFSQDASISSSGRFVAFKTNASNLPGHGEIDVYIHDLRSAKTRLASRAPDGSPAFGGFSGSPSISPSARHIAFTSTASNLPGSYGGSEVYLRGPLTSSERRKR